MVFLALPEQAQILVQKPGRYFVVLKANGGNEEIIGEFYCQLVERAPLTPEREVAIESNPRAVKAVRAEYGAIYAQASTECTPPLNVCPRWRLKDLLCIRTLLSI